MTPLFCRPKRDLLIQVWLYLCLHVYSGVKHILPIWVTWRLSYKRQELEPPPVFGEVHAAHFFSFLCCVLFLLCFACAVSCVPNFDPTVSGLSILDCSFGFLWHLFPKCNRLNITLWSKTFKQSV